MRLARARDIARVFRDGYSLSNPYVILRARRRCDGTSAARLAFALARRHVASAVHRNRVKRIVRESFRRHGDLLRGYDVVVVSRSGLSAADGRDLRKAVDREWRRLLAEPIGQVPRRRSKTQLRRDPPAGKASLRDGIKRVLPAENE